MAYSYILYKVLIDSDYICFENTSSPSKIDINRLSKIKWSSFFIFYSIILRIYATIFCIVEQQLARYYYFKLEFE